MKQQRKLGVSSVEIGPRPRFVFLYLVFCVVMGALLAPQVMKVLLWLGRNFEPLQQFRDLEFERVTTRTVMVVLVLTLWPMLKCSGMAKLDSIGLQCSQGWVRNSLAFFLLGLVSLGLLFGIGWGGGAYGFVAQPVRSWLWKLVGILIGAWIAAMLEEIVFRGLLFRLLRCRSRLFFAVLWSSILFSLVHFMRPEPIVGIAHPHWYSGLTLVPFMFRWVHATFHYFPIMLTLFLMGVTLCLVVERYQSLWAAIGLHAGWIVAMRGCVLWLERNPDVLPFWFGGMEGIAKTYVALVFASVICFCFFQCVRQRVCAK